MKIRNNRISSNPKAGERRNIFSSTHWFYLSPQSLFGPTSRTTGLSIMLLEPRMQERLCPTKYPLYPLRFVAWVPNSMECESSCREQPIRLNPTLPSRLISICPTDSFRQKPISQSRPGLRQLTGEAGSILLSLDDSVMQGTETAQTVNGRARQERARQEGHNRNTPCC